jgi:hypothetical protein
MLTSTLLQATVGVANPPSAFYHPPRGPAACISSPIHSAVKWLDGTALTLAYL